MEEALPLARNFNDAHAKFNDWSVKMEPKVKQKDAQESEEQVVVRFILEIQNIANLKQIRKYLKKKKKETVVKQLEDIENMEAELVMLRLLVWQL